MNKQDLIALAERVEKAEGPDRELDALIEAVRRSVPKPGVNGWIAVGDRHYERLIPGTTAVEYFVVRRYTASLDAAMTLVPEGCGYEVASDYSDEWDSGFRFYRLSGRFNARVYLAGGGSFEANAATPALALTAASLRAIAETPHA